MQWTPKELMELLRQGAEASRWTASLPCDCSTIQGARRAWAQALAGLPTEDAAVELSRLMRCVADGSPELESVVDAAVVAMDGALARLDDDSPGTEGP